ncbi:MAG: peptidoglycan-binding protein [Thermoanaerobaculia bacterium]
MADEMKVAKAELSELDANLDQKINPEKATKVQFNPDSLKVTFANQIQQPQGGGDQSGPQAQQFVGAGSTKLAVQLWFDVTQTLGELPDVMDVRELTQRVAYFITPKGDPPSRPTRFLPPAVRFAWGTFQFDGMMEGMEETLELFSSEGRPLRASVAITLTQQKITTFAFNQAAKPPGFTRRGGGAGAGENPQTQAPEGSTLQGLSQSEQARRGGGGSSGVDLFRVAAANDLESLRRLEPGRFVDFRRTKPLIVME